LESILKNADPNPENNPVPLTDATPTDGKTEVSFSGDKITIKGIDGKTGDYQVRVDFGSDDGGRGSATIAGYAYDLLDVQGVLQDNETHSTQPGIIRVYDGKIDSTTGTNRRIGEIPVNASGQFNTRFNFRVEDLDNYLSVAGKKVENGTQESFVRTMKLPKSDQKGLILRVVPYTGLAENGITPEDFRQFMYDLNWNEEIPLRFDFNGEFIKDIPGFHGLEGIQILSENPFGVQYGTFSSATQQQVESKILDENDINGIIGSYRIKPEQIFIGNSPAHFTLDGTVMGIDSNWVIPDPGWIIVTPRSDMRIAGTSISYQKKEIVSHGTITKGTIYIIPDAIINIGIFSHEFEHMFDGPGISVIISPDKTIMNQSTGLSTISTTGPADKKVGKVNYEPSFMVFPQAGYPHVDSLENILGLKFPDEK
jgi:hypothetical protein